MDLHIAKKQFADYLNYADPSVTITELHQIFIIEKMKLDKYFSVFLDENETEMNQSENFDSASWQTYREKLKEYDAVERLVTHSKYYLTKYVR
jgi:hypothetical protein